jgi:hypothetical protein
MDPSNECYSVMGDLCMQVPRDTHNSAIMSWKIASSGDVTNAMPELYPHMVTDGPDELGHTHSGGHAFFED